MLDKNKPILENELSSVRGSFRKVFRWTGPCSEVVQPYRPEPAAARRADTRYTSAKRYVFRGSDVYPARYTSDTRDTRRSRRGPGVPTLISIIYQIHHSFIRCLSI